MRFSLCCLALSCIFYLFNSAGAACYKDSCIPNGYSCKKLFPSNPHEYISKRGACNFVNGGQTLPGKHTARCCTTEAEIELFQLKNTARALIGASDHEYPHQIWFRPGGGACGGTVYNKEWIVTAAHCVQTNGATYVQSNGDLPGTNKKAFVIAGENNVFYAPESSKYPIDKVIMHPKWIHNDIGQGNDIALLHLSRSLPLEKGKIQPLRMEPANYVPHWGGKGFVVGFGNVDERLGNGSEDMMEKAGPIHSNAKATGLGQHPLNAVKSSGPSPSRSILSVGGEESGLVVGKGDSGGPFICPDENNKPILCGIASYKSCEPFKECKRPSYFTRVAPFLEWIKKETGNAVQEEDLIFDKTMFPDQIPEPEAPGYLVRIGGNERSCTGALVGPRLILTAGECIAANNGQLNVYHIKTGTDISSYGEIKGNKLQRDISANFSSITKQHLNRFDLGAIITRVPIEAEYAQLAPEGYQQSGEVDEYSFNSLTNSLERRHFVPLTEDDCLRRIEGLDKDVKFDFEEQLCMRQVYSAEAVCERDIGGPLMCEGGKYMCGIKSFHACKYPGVPEIFERTSSQNNVAVIEYFKRGVPK